MTHICDICEFLLPWLLAKVHVRRNSLLGPPLLPFPPQRLGEIRMDHLNDTPVKPLHTLHLAAQIWALWKLCPPTTHLRPPRRRVR